MLLTGEERLDAKATQRLSSLLQLSDSRGVVSNNSEEAVKEFLHRFGWTESIRVLSCRTPSIALKLKPDPFLVEKAVALLGVDAADCVFVGDSVTDVEAGNAAGVRVVGLRQLFGAGAVAVIER